MTELALLARRAGSTQISVTVHDGRWAACSAAITETEHRWKAVEGIRLVRRLVASLSRRLHGGPRRAQVPAPQRAGNARPRDDIRIPPARELRPVRPIIF